MPTGLRIRLLHLLFTWGWSSWRRCLLSLCIRPGGSTTATKSVSFVDFPHELSVWRLAPLSSSCCLGYWSFVDGGALDARPSSMLRNSLIIIRWCSLLMNGILVMRSTANIDGTPCRCSCICHAQTCCCWAAILPSLSLWGLAPVVRFHWWMIVAIIIIIGFRWSLFELLKFKFLQIYRFIYFII